MVTNYHVIQSALQRPAHGQPPKKIKVSLHGSSEAIEAQVRVRVSWTVRLRLGFGGEAEDGG